MLIDREQNNRLSVLAYLVAHAQSPLGRTAIMKLCYFLQSLRVVPLGYRFSLYSYGPFDSEVLSDLSAAEQRDIVHSSVVAYSGGYGYQIEPGLNVDMFLEQHEDIIDEHRESLDWVLKRFGALTAAELELLSTIVYVDQENSIEHEFSSSDELAQKVKEIKPRFDLLHIKQKVGVLTEEGLVNSLREKTA